MATAERDSIVLVENVLHAQTIIHVMAEKSASTGIA
jgi:hypothetical protein